MEPHWYRVDSCGIEPSNLRQSDDGEGNSPSKHGQYAKAESQDLHNAFLRDKGKNAAKVKESTGP